LPDFALKAQGKLAGGKSHRSGEENEVRPKGTAEFSGAPPALGLFNSLIPAVITAG
jgi:hypothetical protein